MNYYDIIFEGWAVPRDFKCDGCSIPQPLHKWLKAERWDNTGCKLHDFHRVYHIIPRKESDRILKRFILAQDDSWNYKLAAFIGYYIVRIARSRKNIVYKELPKEWEMFKRPIGDFND